MRFTKRLLAVLGVAFLVLGALGMVWAASSSSYLALGLGSGSASLIFVGVVMFFAARYVGRLDTRDTIADGTPGTGQVLDVRDTGVIVNNVNLVVEVRLLVQADGHPPYEATTRIPLGRTQWGAIQPGMTLPVRIDRDDPDHVAIDTSRPIASSAVAGVPSGGVAAGGVPAVTMTAADIVAAGAPATARLELVEPTGLTAGAVASGLPAERADDPVVRVAFTYAGPGGDVRVENMVRVPDGKAGFLATGREVPIRYLPSAPATATIDWDRLS